MSAQEAPASTGEAQNAASPSAQAQLDAALDAYKSTLRSIESLRSEYQTAPESQHEKLHEELLDLVKQGKEQVSAMLGHAAEAYRANPVADSEADQLLRAVARHSVVGHGGSGGDQYEQGLQVIDALVDGGAAADEKQLPLWGFVAAMFTNDFEAADRFLAIAKENGSLASQPEGEEAIAVYKLAMQHLPVLGDLKAMWAKEQQIRADEAAADDLPRVLFKTTKGDITLELFENEAPTAVANFVTLVKEGYYDGLLFHRVLGHFMAQGGDPLGTGSGGPGYSIACECYQPNARMHFRGSLSMAHAGRDSGGSQFFLTFTPTMHLNGKHTVFGRVIDGIEVLGELQRTDGEGAPPRDKILTAEVLRDRGHDYKFEKLPGR
ncbi:peptidylprolyl isomerase [Pseudobythopirellula maris]|uniref:peptidylprolyl isomerase n=1 Tax=Pseudobythopirellula maris TaxID=2527991 RepID=UPI0018D2850A|nr:peptidylprolyl isomerase [Pseudobythopirellula maris]